jgi:hypothetical protein
MSIFASPLLLFALAADPIAWKVAESPVQAQPGAVVKLRIQATIGAGWHLYALKEIPGGPKPTRFTVEAPAELAGKVEAPDPLVAEDSNFNAEVEYYEESAEFAVPVRLPAKLPERVVVRVRYQSCSDKECLPPKTVELSVAVRP